MSKKRKVDFIDPAESSGSKYFSLSEYDLELAFRSLEFDEVAMLLFLTIRAFRFDSKTGQRRSGESRFSTSYISEVVNASESKARRLMNKLIDKGYLRRLGVDRKYGSLYQVSRALVFNKPNNLKNETNLSDKTVFFDPDEFVTDEEPVRQEVRQNEKLRFCRTKNSTPVRQECESGSSSVSDRIVTSGDNSINTININNTNNTTGSALSCDALFTIWNQHCDKLPKANVFTPKRKKAASARLKELPDLDYWVSVARTLAASPFCNAKTGGTWKADFDFYLKPDTHVKASEGKYGVFKKASPPPPHSTEFKETEADRRSREKEERRKEELSAPFNLAKALFFRTYDTPEKQQTVIEKYKTPGTDGDYAFVTALSKWHSVEIQTRKESA